MIQTYLTVMFWLYVINAIIYGVVLTTSKYPRKVEVSVTQDLFTLLWVLGFLCWVSQLRV